MAGTVALAGTFHTKCVHQLPALLINFEGAHSRPDKFAQPIQHKGRGFPCFTHPLLVFESFTNHRLISFTNATIQQPQKTTYANSNLRIWV